MTHQSVFDRLHAERIRANDRAARDLDLAEHEDQVGEILAEREVEECPHFGRPLDFPTECTICSGADKKLREQQAEAPRTFPAKFASQCPECNLPIVIGSLISWVPGRPAVHADCWES